MNSPPPPLPELTGIVPESPRVVARRERMGRLAYRIGAISTTMTVGSLFLIFVDTHAPSALGLRAFGLMEYVPLLVLIGLVAGGLAVAFATFFGRTARGQQSVLWFIASIGMLFLWSFADKIWPPPP